MSAVLFSSRPGLAVLVSLVAAGLIALSGRSPNLREFWSLLAAVVKFSLVVSLLPPVLDGSIVVHDVLPIVPGADLSF
ncbi:MAG TPA: monovalent cation/H+ antiporter subunit D family protein, partial [Bacillota bacterium]